MDPKIEHCPACCIEDSRLRIAIHLLEAHRWSYESGMTWLRNLEESTA